ncbi:MAG: Na+/H+ antiporter NhaA, partial [Bacteroidales bacterium]|nr:Na+/H+ antiporter NhaA [Bacteroidales bacterium]
MAKLIPIYTWNKGLLAFNKRSNKLSRKPWFQGALLLACVVVAMLLANLPFTKDLYHSILDTDIQLRLASPDGAVNVLFPRDLTVEGFINDILMVIFFFSVGLEIRREVAHGELSSVKKALLPVIAAFGGVIAPAVIYTLINHGTAAASGWGIPTATDIAFAVCILSVLSDKVPTSLKVFLTALAIADDLIAILVVALFYGGAIKLPLLLIALGVIAFTLLLRKLGEKHLFPYVFFSVVVWALFYYSGIHATMSGVVMAFLIPAQS